MNILEAIQRDPNVSRAFAAALPVAPQYANWIIYNRLGQPCGVAFARSATEALNVYPLSGATARLQRYDDEDDHEIVRNVSHDYGRLD